MITAVEMRRKIEEALAGFNTLPLDKTAVALLDVLGYRSSRRVTLSAQGLDELAAKAGGSRKPVLEAELKNRVGAIHFLLQLTGDEIQAAGGQDALPFQTKGPWDGSVIESYLFFAVDLKAGHYSRTDLSKITRAINRLFAMPAMLLFRHGDTATLAVIHRRLHKLDDSKDVLEKVTLIKDVRFLRPHRAHIEILFDLSLPELMRGQKVTNFVQLHNAWRKTLDSSELNKRFFKELADWYFWALQNAQFPEPAFVKDSGTYQAQNVIRLITRLIFCWFLKEKGLIPADLFEETAVGGLLTEKNPKRTTYYRAILQNLFFATLNTPMNSAAEPQNRRFCRKSREDHMIHSYYRAEELIADRAAFLALMQNIPFLNGGLFECLDRRDQEGEVRIDGFSTEAKKCPAFPDFLFFAEQEHPDLNKAYGTTDAKFTVRGILKILDRYKFTVAENTPIEEEVALDPELLGRVFENLLAAYNPETGATARKQTGSFYTPREIVNYMVDEALIARLKTTLVLSFRACEESQKLGPEKMEIPHSVRNDNSERETENERKLRHLFAYNDQPHQFSPREVAVLIAAIDDLKILDPACGSGAFPMGILHQLVHILGKLDPHNKHWMDRQLDNARAMTSTPAREAALAAVEAAFARDDDDYGRKLYLIENCIYGVDIQPIAVQIAKLRFFISLIVNQTADDTKPNRDILSLPNLETKIVAANTLLGLPPKPTQAKAHQMGFGENDVVRLEKELRDVRRRHFSARSWPEKKKLRDRDAELRQEIAARLKSEWGYKKSTATLVADWNPYDQNSSARFFDPEWMFNLLPGATRRKVQTTLGGNLALINEVPGQTELVVPEPTGGYFDVTIGNPPYVRADEPSEWNQRQRKQILESGDYATLWEKWDLFVPFIERGYKLLKLGGVTTLIVSDAFCHSKYAEKAQAWYLENARILRLDFCSDLQIFDAAVHNLIYFFQRADGSIHKPQRRVHKEEFGNVVELPSDEQSKLTHRVFFPEDRRTVAFDCKSIDLGAICYISVGMVVHADEKVAKGAFELDDVVSETRDALHPRRFVEGKHLARWSATETKWLEWGTKRAPTLFRRQTFIELYTVPEKIFIHRTAGEDLRSCYDSEETLCNHTIMVCLPWHSLVGVRNKSIKKTARYSNEKPSRPNLPKREDLEKTSRHFAVKYLLGVMNSSAARNFLRANRRSNTDLYPDDWKNLPIPAVPAKQQEPIVKLVDQILTAKRKSFLAEISDLENRLDVQVRRLYGLPEEETKTEAGGSG